MTDVTIREIPDVREITDGPSPSPVPPISTQAEREAKLAEALALLAEPV